MTQGKIINLPRNPAPTLDEIVDWRIEINDRYRNRVFYSDMQKAVFIFINSIDHVPFMMEKAKEIVLGFLAEEAQKKMEAKDE